MITDTLGGGRGWGVGEGEGEWGVGGGGGGVQRLRSVYRNIFAETVGINLVRPRGIRSFGNKRSLASVASGLCRR